MAAKFAGNTPAYPSTVEQADPASTDVAKIASMVKSQLLNDSPETLAQLYAANPATMGDKVEYKEMPKNLKGGKVCVAHLTEGCEKGESCPHHHTKSKRICLAYQTKQGCSRAKCPFAAGHEIIGRLAAMAVQDWAKKKSTSNKEKAKGGSPKTENKKGKGKGTEKFDTPCKWYQKGKCFKGDACPYVHTKAGP